MTLKIISPGSNVFVFALSAIVFLSGCVAVDVKIDPNRKASVHKILVHPMEPPRLETRGSSKAYQAVQVLGLLVGVLPIGGGDAASERSRPVSDGTWHPTKILARQVEAHLKGRNIYDVGILLPVTELFGSNKGDLYDPYAPIRDWYNSDHAAKGTLAANSDVVIEVGIWNFELNYGNLLLSVNLRAVDPATGEVLGRARAYEQSSVGSKGSSNANEAQQFKELFAGMARRLTQQALRQLGL